VDQATTNRRKDSMAEIKVVIDSEDINKSISDAIVNSILGETIVEMVNEFVKGLPNRYDSPVKKALEEEVYRIVKELVLERQAEIRAAVEKQMADGLVERLTTTLVEKLSR